MTQFDRIFQLHRLLAGRRTVVSFQHIEQELECSRATARRVIEQLRDVLGAPLIYDRAAGGYRYDGEGIYELPGLWFSAGELAALLTLDALTAAEPSGLVNNVLAPFRARLEALLAQEGMGLPNWRSRLRLLDAHARKPGPWFAVVAGALAQRQQLQLDYRARGDAGQSHRRVSPQRLTRYRGNWYLDAYCHSRQALRSFSLERIEAASALPDQPARELEIAQLDQELSSSYGIFSGLPTAVAVLRFSPRISAWVADELWHPDQQDQPLADGGLERRIPYHNGQELAMEALRYGEDVEVVEPEPLRRLVAYKLRKAAAHYAY